MVQVRQGIQSIKPKPTITKCKQPEPNRLTRNKTPSQELHIKVEDIRKLYTDDTRRFPVRSLSVNQYIMVAYHCDSSAIIAAPFKSRSDKQRILSCGAIVQQLKNHNMLVELEILDN